MDKTIFDDFEAPPAAALLGWRLIALDAERGWIRVVFDAKPAFTSPTGFIQGGILAAMLDDTMGPAFVAMTGATAFPATIDMNVSFLAPAKPGVLFGEGWVVQRGKTIAYLQAELADPDGVLIARSTASARVVAANFERK